MPKVEIETDIEAPQKQVWEFISDIEKAPGWVSVMDALIETTDNPLKEGSVYQAVSKTGLKKSKTEWKVSYFDAPHMQAHECNESDFRATLAMRVEDNGDGTSTLFYSIEYELMPASRIMGSLAETLFIKRTMRKRLQESVENCKRMIEERFKN